MERKEIREYFGTEYAAVEAEGFEFGGCVLKTKGLTDEDLAKVYGKVITAKIDGEWVGWAGVPSFIHYYCTKGMFDSSLKDVSYWGNEGCRFHQMLQYCLQGKEVEDLLNTERNNEVFHTKGDKERYLSFYYGRQLPRARRLLMINVRNKNS